MVDPLSARFISSQQRTAQSKYYKFSKTIFIRIIFAIRDLPENYRILAGATYINEPESTHYVVTIYTHPLYNPYNLENDISVWEVSSIICV